MWQGLVDELSDLSPEFRTLWDRHEVESHNPKVKSLLHPLLGPTRFAVTSLWYADQPGTRIVIYTPCGQEAERTRRMLAEMEPWLPWKEEPERAAAGRREGHRTGRSGLTSGRASGRPGS